MNPQDQVKEHVCPNCGKPYSQVLHTSCTGTPSTSTQGQVELEERRAGKILLDLIDTRTRDVMLDLFLREIAPALEDTMVRRIVREEIASVMAAALADPQVDEHAKSLAGYVLQWLQDE